MPYTKLKPHVRTLELLGGTGDGKTDIATVPADLKAREILKKAIGETNSTLNERIFVYTNEYSDKIVIAVKHEENAFTRNQFTEVISKSIAQVVKSSGKATAARIDKEKDELKDALRTQLLQKNNTKAILSLLTEAQVETFIKDVGELYHKFNLHQYNYNIYNTVKNDLMDIEIKENSKKFLSAIQQEVEKTIDMQSTEFKENLWKIWEEINDNLSGVFFNYFSKADISDDGYYYKEIMLNAPDTNFISAMFTANNIQAGQKLSLEVLCNEIVIYVPIRKEFSKLIADNPITSKVFRDSMDHIVFATLDTRGLYHADSTDDQNEDYCSELFYKGEIDAIAMVAPLVGDTNEKKIGELYKDVLRNFHKEIPVFMIHNKLDLYVSDLLKKGFDDPLSLDEYEQREFSEQDWINSIDDYIAILNDNISSAKIKAKKKLPIKSLTCYLKRDASFPKELLKRFNILKVYETILVDMAMSLENSAYKIKFQVEEGEIAIPVIASDRLAELVHIHVTDSTTEKKVFTPGMSDIALSIGKTPHGNAYNALRRRLKNGDGYTSNIDESYFYNCKSFAVNFTANLRNFASKEFIHSVVSQALDVTGTKRTPEANEKFMRIVESYVDPKELVSFLLYHIAMLNAEKNAFSFRGKFQNFLQNSMLYFDSTQIDEVAYAEAVEQIILEATSKALDLNVTFR